MILNNLIGKRYFFGKYIGIVYRIDVKLKELGVLSFIVLGRFIVRCFIIIF